MAVQFKNHYTFQKFVHSAKQRDIRFTNIYKAVHISLLIMLCVILLDITLFLYNFQFIILSIICHIYPMKKYTGLLMLHLDGYNYIENIINDKIINMFNIYNISPLHYLMINLIYITRLIETHRVIYNLKINNNKHTLLLDNKTTTQFVTIFDSITMKNIKIAIYNPIHHTKFTKPDFSNIINTYYAFMFIHYNKIEILSQKSLAHMVAKYATLHKNSHQIFLTELFLFMQTIKNNLHEITKYYDSTYVNQKIKTLNNFLIAHIK